MKKQVLIYLSLLMLVFILSSCFQGSSPNTGNSSSSIPAHPGGTQKPPQPNPDSANISESSSISQEKPSASESSDANVEKSVTGTIDDIAVGNIYLVLDDGMTLIFAYAEADLSRFTNSLPGSRITIYYTGKIDGNDTSNAKVTRIENTD